MKPTDLSDEALLWHVKKGNRVAFNAIYDRHWDHLYQASYKIFFDEDLAKDTVQEVFLDFWVRKEELDVKNLAGYLYQAVRFQSLKQLRKGRILDIHEEHFQNVLKVNVTEEQLNLNQLEETLDRSLMELPEKHRMIFEMSRIQNMSNKEIAEKLQLSQRTVEWYLHTVLKHLKTSLTSFCIIAAAVFFT